MKIVDMALFTLRDSRGRSSRQLDDYSLHIYNASFILMFICVRACICGCENMHMEF